MAAPGPPVAKEQCTASLAGARPAGFTSVPGRATVAFKVGRVAESNFCGTPLLQTNQEKNGGIASKSNQPKPKKV